MRIRTLAAAVTAAALTSSPLAAVAQTAPAGMGLTVLATTDIHGHIYDWDYFTDQPYPADDSLGLTRAATAIKEIRAEEGEDSVVLLDNGDNIQGSPLTSYYANQENILDTGAEHPMATANNLLDYDAQVIGNHEFNYGLDFFRAYEEDADYPIVGANALDATTGEPIVEPYTLVERVIDGEEVTVGVLGLTPPGSRIWDAKHLDGKVEFADIVETAQKWAPEARASGADVVVALAHSGKDHESQEWDPSKLQDDLARTVAEESPEIDVVVAGHSHQDEPEEIITRADGSKALITQPSYWGRSVSEITLPLVADSDGDGFAVDWESGTPTATPHYMTDYAEDQELVDALAEPHEKTVDYVATVVGTATEDMPAKTSRYEDTAILDFINHVQAEYVREAMAGTEYEDLPVLSQASPFSRDAIFREGDVTVRDVAGLYVYDNTLAGVKITGAQLRDYLEFSARYYEQVGEGEDFDPEQVTNAFDDDRGREIPDYSYDVVSGVSYDVNISKPVGDRIENLVDASGEEIADDAEFVMAINNYRQSGGSGYPVADLEQVYDEQIAIREALIDWVVENEVIDPADFYTESWWLVSETREPGEDPTEEPTEDPTDDPTDEPTDDPSDPGRPGEDPSEDPGDDGRPDDDSDDRGDGGGDDGKLPRTGAGIGAALGLGAGLALLGGAAVLISRRRA